jgi:chromosome segregation ATPase
MMQQSVQPEIVLFTAICFGIVISLATLFVSFSASREGRRISKTLEERLSKVEHDLQRARWAEKDAQKKLEEQRPERLSGKLEHATGEIEQLQLRLSESERLVGQQKQELSQQSERQKRERQRLEQEHQHLMEEIERWHKRYVESQQQVDYLKQEHSEAQQKVEQLTHLRERLLEEMDSIDNTSITSTDNF